MASDSDSDQEIRFKNLYEEIRTIDEDGETHSSLKSDEKSKKINIIKNNKFKKLFIKMNEYIELKLVIHNDYPKVSPASMEILYSKYENLASENDEALAQFLKTSTLALNKTIDCNHRKCCVYKMYRELRNRIVQNVELMPYLQPVNTFSVLADENDESMQQLIRKQAEEKAAQKQSSSDDECATENEKVKLKGSDIIFERIKWDESIDKDFVIIGYLDRFKGIMEIAFNEFKQVHEDYREGVPLHRIRYYKINNKIVWDRRNRVDLLTGHNVSEYFQQ